MKTEKKTLLCIVETKVNMEDVRSLLVGALEGGSNYWMTAEKLKFPKETSEQDFKAGGKFAVRDTDLSGTQYWPACYVLPFIEGGGVVIKDWEDDKTYTLNLKNVKKGLQLMAEQAPQHFADFISENTDCDTSDVFLQFCLLGDIVYG